MPQLQESRESHPTLWDRVPATSPRLLSLRSSYRTLDAVVLAAYGFSAKADLLVQIFALNESVAAALKHERWEKRESRMGS